MARGDLPRLAVLGAGPVGLEAALYAVTLGLPVTVYERGTVGTHLRQWGHVRLFSPFGLNCTRLGVAVLRAEKPQHALPGERDCVTGHVYLAAYLEPLAGTALLRDRLRLGQEVLGVGRRGHLKGDLPGDPRRGRQPFLLVVRDAAGRERVDEADVVLDCSGTYGRHRWLGEGGLPALGEKACAAHIAYGLEDVRGDRRPHYAGRNIMVVGAGYSAATTVVHLAALAQEEPATWVIWVARGSGSQPIKRLVNETLAERDRLAMRANLLATRPEGNVEFHNQTVIEAVEAARDGLRVTGRSGGQRSAWEVERLIANVGYTPDADLYRELQVRECYASLSPLTLARPGAAALPTPEPNFYVLGAKSYGRNSQFLLRDGFEQVRAVFALIAGKPELNLYKK